MLTVQQIRLVDVFVLGPLMIYFGVKATGVPILAKQFMFISGVFTIIFNGSRFLDNVK